MVDDATGLQADFMPVIHGVRSFEGLRSRAVERTISGMPAAVKKATAKRTPNKRKKGQR